MPVWQDILSRLFLGNEAIVVGIFRGGTDKPHVHAVWVSRKKSEISLTRERSYESIAQFVGNVGQENSHLPIILCIDDGNIVYEQGDEALTMFDPDEFYVEYGESHDYHAVIRQTSLVPYLEEFGTLKFRVAGIYLGAVHALHWIEGLDVAKPYFLGDHEVDVRDEEVSMNLSTASRTTEIEQESFNAHALMLFLTSFSFFLSSSVSQLEVVNQNLKELLFANALKKTLTIGVAALFVVFLTSTSFFFFFESENEKLSESFYEQNMLHTKAENYRKEIVRLEDILDTENRYPVFTRIGTDLAKVVPSDISFKELKIFPADISQMKRQKQLVVRESVEIVGQSASMNHVADWIADIKDLPWVADILSHEIDQKEEGYEISITIAVDNVE